MGLELEEETSDYLKYRGKCKEFCDALLKEDSTLTLVRGWYDCPIWGMQQHWWCRKPDGTVVDPTKLQFPSKGIGQYIEFDGMFKCEFCHKPVHEDGAYRYAHHVYCSPECYGHDVGF